MGNEMRIFESEQFGRIRTLTGENGEPWFVGNEVAKILGYSNYRNAIVSHVEDEDKLRTQIEYAGQNREVTIINESGLYSLILSSKLPQAREFKHWVTADVLPQIRKTGGYLNVNDNDDDSTIMAKALIVAQKTIELKNALLLAQKPKVDFANAVVGSDGSILIRDLAKVITQNGVKMGQNRLFYWLRKHGYLFQRETRPIQKWVEKGIFEISEGVYDGVISITTKVTGKGQEYIVNGFQSGKFNAGEFAGISFND